MANDDKSQNQQSDSAETESNAGMDHDHGNMNNGAIGGNMGVIGNSCEQDSEQNQKQANPAGTGAPA